MTVSMDPPATASQVAEISTKLDVLISQHTMMAAQIADHETRMRAVESKQTTTDAHLVDLVKHDVDQEDRLRKADQWRYAIPATAVTGTGALLAGAAALITALQGG